MPDKDRSNKNPSKKSSERARSENASPAVTRNAGKSSAEIDRGSFEDQLFQKFELLSSHLVALEERLTRNISDLAERFNQQFAALNNTIKELQHKFLSLERSVGDNSKGVSAVEHKITDLQQQCDDLNRQQRLSDVVIRGIPLKRNENPLHIFHSIAATLQQKSSTFITAFRSRSHKVSPNDKSSTADIPIIVKFPSRNEARQFLSAVRSYNEGRFSLDTIDGFTAASSVYFNESLSGNNIQILREALQLRKSGALHSVYTKDGLVHIRVKRGNREVKIRDLYSLRDIATQREAALAK